MQTQIADVIVPAEFSSYVVQHSIVSTAFAESGVLVPNGVITAQLSAGAENFAVPSWLDLGEVEADIATDNPNDIAVPQKFTAVAQNVRKSYLHQSWSEMNLAAELAGSEPLRALQNRVAAYWDRQVERRLIASLNGVLASNVASSNSDMVVDISGNAGAAGQFNATSVINAAATLGDKLNDIKAIAMHSHIYQQALINDEVQVLPGSQGQPIKTYRGLAVIVDDNLTNGAKYTTVLFGNGAVGYAVAAPNSGYGTELYRNPAAGNGGGQTTLHSRLSIALAPSGYSWTDATGTANALVGQSPQLADLAKAAHWTRSATSRKVIPLAFLLSN